jgi:NAD kinase
MNAVLNRPVEARPAAFEKVVIVTRRTELEELVTRFNTAPQARFYLEHAGQAFEPIAARHARYHAVLESVRRAVPRGLKSQVIDRAFLSQFLFGEADLVMTVGPDGLVVNVAKYLEAQPVFALNPDPGSIDGLLLPFTVERFADAFRRTLQGQQPLRSVTMAQARLNDGQSLLAFNDLFIGARSHVSARYEIAQGGRRETQSSSGIIVSTGAGSTGWLKSVYAGAAAVVTALGGQVQPPPDQGRLPWDIDHLIYSVREPFPSKATQTALVFGAIYAGHALTLTSHMADNGVIFSDGMEADFLAFNAGSTATIGLAPNRARLVVAA